MGWKLCYVEFKVQMPSGPQPLDAILLVQDTSEIAVSKFTQNIQTLFAQDVDVSIYDEREIDATRSEAQAELLLRMAVSILAKLSTLHRILFCGESPKAEIFTANPSTNVPEIRAYLKDKGLEYDSPSHESPDLPTPPLSFHYN
jgi:hypothetical protein